MTAVSGTTLNAESGLTFDGTTLQVLTSGSGTREQINLKNQNASAGTSRINFFSTVSGSEFTAAGIRNGVNTLNQGRLFLQTNQGSGLTNTLELYETGNVKVTNGQLEVEGGGISFLTNNKTIQTGSSSNMLGIQGGATNMGGRIELRGGNDSGDIRFYAQGTTSTQVERLRLSNDGHLSLRNAGNSPQEIQWYSNTSLSASIGWGNGSANWEFKHYRADSQAGAPYANIDFFTGSTSSPTRALRITEDGMLLLGETNDDGMTSYDLGMKNGRVIRHRNAAGNAWINTFGLDSSNNIKIGWGGSPNEIHFGISGIGEVAKFNTSGAFKPTSNNSYDLGTSSDRWRNVYTTDLQLSNEGKNNDVDGTWGNYTIQEGESDLFLINNRNGKKYKFNLTEVS